uniref:Uncharacterized protein n=1 Tax=viral metagenome TaxID=1070528 RepID=A0A6C0CXI1_9ZZZZ
MTLVGESLLILGIFIIFMGYLWSKLYWDC